MTNKMNKAVKMKYERKAKRFAKEVAKQSDPIMLEMVLNAVAMDLLDTLAFGYDLTLDEVKADILYFVPCDEMSIVLGVAL